VDSMGRDMMHSRSKSPAWLLGVGYYSQRLENLSTNKLHRWIMHGCDEDGSFTLQSQVRKGDCSFSSVLMD
jgi:hypothetical protein